MTRQFVEKVTRSEIAMRPVLPLGQPVNLGHVGTIGENGSFNHIGTIKTILGLNSLGRELPSQQSPLRVAVTSGRGVSVNFGVNAKTDDDLAKFADLKGKASISFGEENSFFAAVDGLKIRQLKEPHLLFNAILTAYGDKVWKEDWAFIHQIGIARRFTVILGSEAQTTVLLKASAQVAATAKADVDLTAGFKFVASTKAVTQIVGGRNLAAFFNAYRVKDVVWGKPRIEQYRLVMPFGADLNTYPPDTKRASAAQVYSRV